MSDCKKGERGAVEGAVPGKKIDESLDEKTTPVDMTQHHEFPVGAMVRLRGLSKTEFNYHVGRVISDMCKKGRIGVSLHQCIWPNEREGDDSNADTHFRRSKNISQAISFKPENLQLVQCPMAGAALSLLDCPPQNCITRWLGESCWGLPDNVAESIAGYLRIENVMANEISVSGCSSHRGDFSISTALNAKEDEWWISDAGSMPGGEGSEYLEFYFGGMRRVSYIALKIPPLPYGPLSVRNFHLLASKKPKDPNSWYNASPNPMKTLNRADLQEFALVPPCEAESIRLVCTLNAAAAESENGLRNGRMGVDCIGLFQVAFA